MKTHLMQERLRDRVRWLNEFKIYREHKDLTEKAIARVYDENPVISLVFKIYILPTLILNQLVKLRDMHNCRKICREIEIIQSKIKEDENQK